jgi:glyoxylase-like metal-dependent hydrolase (beta-lactamase superfamily II)
MVDFNGGPVTGNLEVRWIHGSASRDSDTDPPIQVHAYDDHTYVLRQSKVVSHEAPFLYLFFGNDAALLLDTGASKDATRFPLRETVDGIVASWLAANPRDGYGLVVAHTHAHGDHIAADTQFADRPLTTVVGTDLDSVRSFFGFTSWPDQVASYDLGGRVLEVIGIPGHHPTSLAMFDPWTGFLLTGDTVYPGRLYGFDMPAFVASIDRLVDFAAARPVTHVMGCHIEMSRQPGRDYPIGARYQPDEPPLQMTTAQLRAVKDATHAAAAKPGVHVADDFVIVSGMGKLTIVRLLVRSFGQRLRGSASGR